MDMALEIIDRFYAGQPDLREILLKHSSQVQLKALQIAEASGVRVDLEIVSNGAMLHDIGIICCHAPDICCHGERPYLAHGIAGAAMLREISLEMEIYARICERHTGSGLSAAEIRSAALPLPGRDFLPETLEEKLICLADKFFSKSGGMKEKSLPKIRRSMEKFGAPSLERFDELCRIFSITE